MAIGFFLKHLPTAAFVVNSKGVLLDTNASFSDIIGCSTSELTGRLLFDFMREGASAKLKDIFAQSHLPRPVKSDITISSINNFTYTLELHISMLNEQGNDIFLVLVNNITHLKRVTDEFREQRRLHKTLVQNMPGVVYRCMCDRDYTMEHLSGRCLDVTGYRPEDLIGNRKVSFNNIIREDYRDRVWKRWSEVLKQRSSFTFEYPIITPNGEERWLWEQGVGVYDDNDNLVALEGILFDVTSRKQADEALRESESLFRTLVENAFDGICLLRNRRLEYANQRFADIVGYTVDEVTHTDFQFKSLFTSRSLEHVNKHLSFVEQNQSIPSQFELQVITSKGELKDVEVSTAVLDSQSDMVVLGIVRDITDRKQAQLQIKESEVKLKRQNEEYLALNEELLETNERIVSINADLLEAKQRAEEHDKLKSAFLANMSHEIRTPMNGILGFSQLLLNSEASEEERQEYIGIIQKSGHQLLAIINDLIDISKIEANQISLDPHKIDINELINEQYLLFSVKAAEKGLFIEKYIDLPNEKFIVEVDDTLLRQVFSHIVGNAFKFTPKGTIRFGYRLRPDVIEFFVEDTGVGIPTGMQEMIFERFRQVEIDFSRQAGGTGLGLAISKALVAKMGGEIWVDSKEHEGSTFYFTIPNKRVQNACAEGRSAEPVLNHDSLGTSNIIIADDNEVNYLYLKQLLKGLDATMVWAQNGKEVVDYVKSQRQVDLILMDIKMPVMDGYEATRIVKQIRPDIPIIAQTAHAMSGDREEALEAGCDEYISKPINRERFLNMVSTLLHQKQ